VFILAERNSRSHAEDAAIASHENGFDVAAIFAVVDLCELLPDVAIFDFLGGALQDDSFVGFFSADDNARVRGDVFCFASARAGAETKTLPATKRPKQA